MTGTDGSRRSPDQSAAAEPLLGTAGDALGVAVFAVDDEGSLLTWNDTFAADIGDGAALAGASASEFFATADRPAVATAIADTVENGRATATATAEWGVDGGTPVDLHCERVTRDGEPVVVVTVRDISERRSCERDLERELDRVEELASAVSHEFLNPLNVVSGRLHLARETGEPDHFDALERAADRLEARVDEVVALGRQGAPVSDPEPVVLDDLARTVWEETDTADASLSTAAGRTVDADPVRLETVYRELFRNAVRHGGEDVTVTVGWRDGRLYVADDGPGITADDPDRLLDYGESTDGGRGFGLALARHVAGAHGWGFSLTESGVGGTRVEFVVDG